MIRRLVVLLLFWVTGSGGVSAGELDSRLADLHKALVDADTRKAYDLVVGLYGNQGIEFPGLIAFHEQPAFELLSRFSSSSNSITQSRLLKAGEGRRYW